MSLLARLAKLEAVRRSPPVRPWRWLAWDDYAGADGEDTQAVLLPAKAPSDAAWAAGVRAHHPAWFDGSAR